MLPREGMVLHTAATTSLMYCTTARPLAITTHTTARIDQLFSNVSTTAVVLVSNIYFIYYYLIITTRVLAPAGHIISYDSPTYFALLLTAVLSIIKGGAFHFFFT